MSLSKVLVLNQKTTTTTTPEARGVLADYMLILPNLVVAFFFFTVLSIPYLQMVLSVFTCRTSKELNCEHTLRRVRTHTRTREKQTERQTDDYLLISLLSLFRYYFDN